MIKIHEPPQYDYGNVYKLWCWVCRVVRKETNPKTMRLPCCDRCGAKLRRHA